MTEIIPNCQEVLYYDAIYAFALKDSSEALSGKSAVSFLMKSNLGMEEIKKIWIATVTREALNIDKENFRNVMRLIAIAQEGYEANATSLKKYSTKASGFAELSGIPSFQSINRALHRFAVQSFNQLTDEEHLGGKDAIAFLQKYEFDKETLRNIWKFVDFSVSLKINLDQWEIVLLLAAYINQGHAFTEYLLLEALHNQPERLEKPIALSSKESENMLDMNSSLDPAPISPPQEAFSIPQPSNSQIQTEVSYANYPTDQSSEYYDMAGLNGMNMVYDQQQQQAYMQMMMYYQMAGMQQEQVQEQTQVRTQEIDNISVTPMVSTTTDSQTMVDQQQQVEEEKVNNPFVEEEVVTTSMEEEDQIENSLPDKAENDEQQQPQQQKEVDLSTLISPEVQHPNSSNSGMQEEGTSMNTPDLTGFDFAIPSEIVTIPSPQPEEQPQQPEEQPQQPQTQGTVEDWMKKAYIVWSRFTDHVFDSCEHPTTLKDTIRGLRMLEVDLNELKRSTALLLESYDSIEQMTTPIFQQFLVLLGNPTIIDTQLQQPLYQCVIPLIPAEQEYCSQANQALQRIRTTIQSIQSSSTPVISATTTAAVEGTKVMYTSLRELYEDLLRKGDLRDLQKLRGYLELQDKIEELEKRPASEGALRKLRQQLPHLKEIISMYSNRDSVPNVLETIRQRITSCNEEFTGFVLPLIPNDPVLFVEMNDLNVYLQRVSYLAFCTDLIELLSVHENASFVQHWMKMILVCKRTVEECEKWIDSIEEDIQQDVLCDQKTREWMRNLQWCIRVAQRVDDAMKIAGSEMDDCYDTLENKYKKIVDKYNHAQKDPSNCVLYERMTFDWRDQCRCELCLHASTSDRQMASLLGRRYHPECANLWMSCIEKIIPVFVEKENSMY